MVLKLRKIVSLYPYELLFAVRFVQNYFSNTPLNIYIAAHIGNMGYYSLN